VKNLPALNPEPCSRIKTKGMLRKIESTYDIANRAATLDKQTTNVRGMASSADECSETVRIG